MIGMVILVGIFVRGILAAMSIIAAIIRKIAQHTKEEVPRSRHILRFCIAYLKEDEFLMARYMTKAQRRTFAEMGSIPLGRLTDLSMWGVEASLKLAIQKRIAHDMDNMLIVLRYTRAIYTEYNIDKTTYGLACYSTFLAFTFEENSTFNPTPRYGHFVSRILYTLNLL